MHLFTRSLILSIVLAMLVACAGVPQPALTPGIPATTTLPTAELLPTAEQAKSAGTTLPQAPLLGAGRLSPPLQMNTGRAAHSATLLPDGKVLIAGGFRQEGTAEVSIASAEVYDPVSNTFTPTGDMTEARSGHTAILLPNGQVLIVGGWTVGRRTASVEVYDPQEGEFHFVANMAAPRAGMSATLLQSGQVLVAGGDTARNTLQLAVEIYDPATNSFLQGGNLNQGRAAHTATLLRDGTVLLIGGRSGDNRVLDSAEIYDPASGKITQTGSLNMVRYKHAAVLLLDGNVLVVGGSNQDDWRGKYTSAEIYDPGTGTFTRIADLNKERFKLADAAVLLDDGNVLIGGGNRQIEIYDAENRRFSLGEKLDNDYYFSVLTLLENGRVLITGGYDAAIRPSDKAWVYN